MGTAVTPTADALQLHASLKASLAPLEVSVCLTQYDVLEGHHTTRVEVICPCGGTEMIAYRYYVKPPPDLLAQGIDSFVRKHIADEVAEGKLGPEWKEFVEGRN